MAKVNYLISNGNDKGAVNNKTNNKTLNPKWLCDLDVMQLDVIQPRLSWKIESGNYDGGLEHETFEAEEAILELQPPLMYQVFISNDDYTPMEFVVDILQRFFNLEQGMATQIMLLVHTQGKGICGVFTRDIAETKVEQVNEHAQHNTFPLLCGMEAVT